MRRFPRSPSPPRAPRFVRRSPPRSVSQPRPPPPRYFRRSPSPHFRPPPPPGYRGSSPPRSPPSPYRRSSPPRPQPSAYRRSSPPRSPPSAYRRSSPPRPPPVVYRGSSPPRMPSRSYSQPRFRASPSRSPRSPPRSPPQSPVRPRSPPRSPPQSPARPRPPWPPDDRRARPSPPSASPALAQRFLPLAAFCDEMLDASGRLLPPKQRPRAPGMPIPAPLRPGEDRAQFERAFRRWLVARRGAAADRARADPLQERVFRFSFAYSRLPVSAWDKPKPKPKPKAAGPAVPSAGGLGAAAMPPRARPFKRGRSVEDEGDEGDRGDEGDAESDVQAKRLRRLSPAGPTARALSLDAAPDASEDIDGVPLSDADEDQASDSSVGRGDGRAEDAAATPRGPADSGSSATAAGWSLKARPERSRGGDEAAAISASTSSGDNCGGGGGLTADEAAPKWAADLLRRVQDLEHEVRSLRRQLSGRQAGSVANDAGGGDSVKAGSVGASAGPQPLPVDPQDAADVGGRDPVRARLEDAYNRLNDEILLNETALAQSEPLVAGLERADDRQARELQAQMRELGAAIEVQRGKRDAALAALVAHCWKRRASELDALLAAPLEPSDAASGLREAHARCAGLAGQLRELSERRERGAGVEAARRRLETEQEDEFAALLGASERLRSEVRSLLKPAP